MSSDSDEHEYEDIDLGQLAQNQGHDDDLELVDLLGFNAQHPIELDDESENEGGHGDEDGGSESGSGGNDDSDEQNDSEDEAFWDSEAEGHEWSTPHCEQTCKIWWEEVHDKAYDRKCRLHRANEEIRQLRAELRDAHRQIEELRRKLAIKRGDGAHTKETWRIHYMKDSLSWSQLHALSCREGNMSPNIKIVHPDLFLRGRRSYEPIVPAPFQTENNFGHLSNRLPASIELRILQHLLVFDQQPVHVLSRLDSFGPVPLPEDANGQPKYQHKFHFGRSLVNVTHASQPHKILAPLQGRFAKGIGARLQRIQHIELLWTGSQYLTYQRTDDGKISSRRTQPLLWLSEARRLLTLKVHLNESDRRYRRRKYEPLALVTHMEKKTNQQPNYRMFRSMRTLQGLDYVMCLRGLKEVNFFDFNLWKDTSIIQQIRDFTFVMDVKNAACREKTAEEKEMSQIRNLAPTVPGYDMPLGDWEALEAFLGVRYGSGEGNDGPLDHDYVPVGLNPIMIDSDDDSDTDTVGNVRFRSGSGVLEEREPTRSSIGSSNHPLPVVHEDESIDLTGIDSKDGADSGHEVDGDDSDVEMGD